MLRSVVHPARASRLPGQGVTSRKHAFTGAKRYHILMENGWFFGKKERNFGFFAIKLRIKFVYWTIQIFLYVSQLRQ